MYRFLISIALMASAPLMAGCGSSADGTASGLSKAQFIEQADRICGQTDKTQNSAIATVLKKSSGASRSATLNEETILLAGLPPIRVEVKELEALQAPEGDEGQVEAFLDEIAKAVEAAEDDPSTMLKSDSLGPFAEASKLGKKYGFKACAFPL